MRCGPKINADKNKVMILNREEGLEYKVYVDGICLEHVTEFKYLGCVWDKSGRDGAECSRKMVSGRRVSGAIRSLVNTINLQLEYARVLHEHCLYLF